MEKCQNVGTKSAFTPKKIERQSWTIILYDPLIEEPI